MVIAEVYANLGWIAMISLKPTPNWDDLGYTRGGRGEARDRVIGTSGDLVIGKPKAHRGDAEEPGIP
jgi:hypothetical protein